MMMALTSFRRNWAPKDQYELKLTLYSDVRADFIPCWRNTRNVDTNPAGILSSMGGVEGYEYKSSSEE